MIVINTTSNYITKIDELDEVSIAIISLLARNEFISADEIIKYIWHTKKIILDELRIRDYIKKLKKRNIYIEEVVGKYRLKESVWVKWEIGLWLYVV